MTIKTQDQKQFLHNMFVTALEGGIGYWSFATEYCWSQGGAGAVTGTKIQQDDLDGFYAIIESNGDDWGVEEAFVAEEGEVQPITETQALTINGSVIERGINMLARKTFDNLLDGDRPRSRIGFMIAWMTDGDEGDYDSDIADIVVQLGLFGEVVYG
jgi:hypothetical protein